MITKRQLGSPVGGALLFGLLCCLGAPVYAEDAAEAKASTSAATDESKVGMSAAQRWRGSGFSWTTVAATRSFDGRDELTYDPYVSMSGRANLRVWPIKEFYINARIGLQRELTHSNYTTYAGETMVDDLTFTIAAPKVFSVGDFSFGTGMHVGLPTSKSSESDQVIFSLTPYLQLSQSFDVLEGLSLSYSFTFGKPFHRTTTSGIRLEGMTRCGIPAAEAVGIAGSSCLSTGVSNSYYRFVNEFGLSISFIKELSLSVGFSLVHSRLYDQSAAVQAVALYDEALSPGGPDTRWRYLVGYSTALSVRPWAAISLQLGLSVMAPQLKPDASGGYTPFYNRYTNLYLQVGLDVATLVEKLASDDEESSP